MFELWEHSVPEAVYAYNLLLVCSYILNRFTISYVLPLDKVLPRFAVWQGAPQVQRVPYEERVCGDARLRPRRLLQAPGIAYKAEGSVRYWVCRVSKVVS